MPLTNAEKQARARAKRNEKLARYEAALREIADRSSEGPPDDSEYNKGVERAWSIAGKIAFDALS